jgi:hypothetical protein
MEAVIMMGTTGLRLLHLGTDKHLTAPQNLVHVSFPQKTVVSSRALLDKFGAPTYRKDIKV